MKKQEENKFIQYCDYEGLVFLSKNKLQEILGLLNIDTSIQNLLRSNTIESVYKNKIYKVRNKNGTIEDLLPLIFDPGEKYYIGGIKLYNDYGFIEQLPSKYQIINTKISEEKNIAGFNIIFSKRKKEYFYGIDEKSCKLKKERAFLDLCYEFGYEIYFSNLKKQKNNLDFDLLITYCQKYPLNKIQRRCLFGINQFIDVPGSIVSTIQTNAIITLTDKKSRRGPIDKKYRIIINQ